MISPSPLPRIWWQLFFLLLLLGISLSSLKSFADERGDRYRERYGLEDVYMKLINNHGDGYDNLYGVRNFRVVLHGVLYRGGANNVWHRENPRDNRNPLQASALNNLCEEGFGEAIYLYSTNASEMPRGTSCSARANNQITYTQISALASESNLDRILAKVHQRIQTPEMGPLFSHCWNGWHASGYVAATALRQFCNLSGEEAVAYWDRNTDGHNDDPRYESIRRRIRNFQPRPEWLISDAEQAVICPRTLN